MTEEVEPGSVFPGSITPGSKEANAGAPMWLMLPGMMLEALLPKGLVNVEFMAGMQSTFLQSLANLRGRG